MIQICYKCFSICIIGLINLLSVISGGYISGETEGHFQNALALMIRVHTRDSSGMVLYGIDTNKNKLLIKAGKLVDGKREFIGHFNGRAFNKNIVEKPSLYTEAVNDLRVNLIFISDNLYSYDSLIGRSQLVLSNIFPSNVTTSDESNNFTSGNKTYFSIGNIDNSFLSSRSTKQSIGCLYQLIFMGKVVKFEKVGHNFSPVCFRDFVEIICKNRVCLNKKRSANVLSCSLLAMNTHAYCFSDLSPYSGKKSSYAVTRRNKNTKILKLAWRQKYSGNYCLLQIKTKNEWISFQTNKFNEIVKCIGKPRSMNCTTKLWHNILPNVIHILVIILRFPYITVQISAGRDVNTYVDRLATYPNQINVGLSSKLTACDMFEGEIAFRYNLTQFKPIIQSGKLISNRGIILSVISVVSLLILLSIVFIAYKIYRQLKKGKKLKQNTYEEPLQLNDVGQSNPNCEYT